MTHEDWMREALGFARQAAACGEVPVGAILVHNEQIIGAGWNQVIRLHDPSAHAEVMALRAAGRAMSNYRHPQTTLYVTLEPCTMCAGALIHARVAHVVFGAYDAKTGVAGSVSHVFDEPHHNHHPTIIGGVLADECGAMLSDFFRQRRLAKREEKQQQRQTKP
ncbi:MAG TPA: tRNA adenosine(34) deaminase TadA [Thiothrix sp.]|nr:tRNA adenosine(34) deaminase TadA [Thiothrix sp.]